MHDFYVVLIALFGGSGAGFGVAKILIENEAKKALKPDIDSLWGAINKNNDEYVTCKFCNMQHDNNGEGPCICKHPYINGVCSNENCPTKSAYDNGYRTTPKQEKFPVIEIE